MTRKTNGTLAVSWKDQKLKKAFTIWCIFYVRRDDENEKRFVNATISQPLDNYPQFAYDNSMLNHQVRQQPDRMSRGISRQTVNSCLYESYALCISDWNRVDFLGNGIFK